MEDLDPEALYAPDGTAYDGIVDRDGKGKPVGVETVCCGRCGGSGKWRRRLECFSCSGAGGKDKVVRLYTATQLAKLEAGRGKRADLKERKEVERASRIDSLFQAYRNDNLDLFLSAETLGNKFLDSLVAKAREWGSLTGPQLDAMRRCVGEAEAAKARYSDSRPYANVGDKVQVEVTCVRVGSFKRKAFKGRRMETVHVTEMADARGNAFLAMTPNFSLKPGERVVLKGTVKSHDDGRGFPATTLKRMSVVERLKASPVPVRPETGEPEAMPVQAPMGDPDDFVPVDDQVLSFGM